MPDRSSPQETDLDAGLVVLPQRFDFTYSRELIKQIKAIPPSNLPGTLRLDCRQTRYIDTAGLGTLLVLGEYFGAKRTIVIEGATGMVQELLAIARIKARLAGNLPCAQPVDLRTCARCGKTANCRCDGTLATARDCPRARSSTVSPMLELPGLLPARGNPQPLAAA